MTANGSATKSLLRAPDKHTSGDPSAEGQGPTALDADPLAPSPWPDSGAYGVFVHLTPARRAPRDFYAKPSAVIGTLMRAVTSAAGSALREIVSHLASTCRVGFLNVAAFIGSYKLMSDKQCRQPFGHRAGSVAPLVDPSPSGGDSPAWLLLPQRQSWFEPDRAERRYQRSQECGRGEDHRYDDERHHVVGADAEQQSF
jgi:hypothetical protein